MTALDDLPETDDNLTGITGRWHRWPVWHHLAVVRRQGTRWIAVAPTRHLWGVYVGPMRYPGAFTELWLYRSNSEALYAATVWESGQPEGWLYHPRTGRRGTRQDADIG